MSAQSEALRLADEMENYFNERGPDAEAVAAELRRLHAEVQEQCRLNGMGSEREAKLMAENNALLEALRQIAETDPVDAALDPQRAVRVARAAIDAAKERT
jgi:hypothetical protein